MSFDRTMKDMADDDFFIAPQSDTAPLNALESRYGIDPSKAVKSVADVFCPYEIVLSQPDQKIDF